MCDHFRALDFLSEVPESPEVVSPIPTVPTFLHLGCDGIPRISPATYAQLLTDGFSSVFDRVETLDCRFAFEHKAGCVCSSINLLQYNQMIEFYSQSYPERTAVVFFCEFSSVRGPKWASLFREHDRNVNTSIYPWIKFPHVYIVEGGFAAIVRDVPFLVSGQYRPANDFNDCESGMVRIAHELFERETDGNCLNESEWNVWGKLREGEKVIEAVPFGLDC